MALELSSTEVRQIKKFIKLTEELLDALPALHNEELRKLRIEVRRALVDAHMALIPTR